MTTLYNANEEKKTENAKKASDRAVNKEQKSSGNKNKSLLNRY